MIYAMSLERNGLPEVLDILSDVVYRPVIGDLEVCSLSTHACYLVCFAANFLHKIWDQI